MSMSKDPLLWNSQRRTTGRYEHEFAEILISFKKGYIIVRINKLWNHLELPATRKTPN